MVHACLPAGVEAVRELHQFLLRDYLPTRFPTMFRLGDEGRQFKNLVTGRSFSTAVPEDPEAALRVIGETVEEDMFLLMGEPEGHRAVAFMCCFPSGFDPSTKVGKLLREIHTPVPSYDKIGPSMERFFGKIEVGKNVKRTNVSFSLFHLFPSLSFWLIQGLGYAVVYADTSRLIPLRQTRQARQRRPIGRRGNRYEPGESPSPRLSRASAGVCYTETDYPRSSSSRHMPASSSRRSAGCPRRAPFSSPSRPISTP